VAALMLVAIGVLPVVAITFASGAVPFSGVAIGLTRRQSFSEVIQRRRGPWYPTWTRPVT